MLKTKMKHYSTVYSFYIVLSAISRAQYRNPIFYG